MAEALTIIEVALCVAEVVERLCTFVSTVKGAKDDIRKLTQELLALKGAMDYFDLQNKKNRDGSLHDQVNSMLSMTQETLDAIRQKLGTPKASSFGRAAQSLAWPFRASDVDKYLRTVERAKTWFIMVLMRDSLDVTFSVFIEMQKLTALIHEEIIARKTDRMLGETADLLKWLSPVNSEDKLVSSRQDRAPGTGNWIRDASYLAWQKGSPTQWPIYWITGRSASGLGQDGAVTMHSSHLVDKLRKRPNNDLSTKAASIGVGFHCCSLDDAASQAVPNVFGSILAQIGATTPELLDHVRPLRRSGNTLIPQNNLSIEQIYDVMGKALEHFDLFYLMIDALNETGHESVIVRALLTLCGRHSNLRVLLTCTREPLKDDSRIYVRHMNNNAIDLDIELYVENRLVVEHGFQSLSPNIRDEIKMKVVSGADGTFRWAKLCMDRLSTLRTGRDVRRVLADIPATLNGFYAGILARIPEQDRGIAHEALTWLCSSLRPLRLNELAEAVVLEEGDADIDADIRLTDPSIILEICQGLAHASDYFVTLAHDSIRTFLQSDWIRTSSASEFAVDAVESHRKIMRKCLVYLQLEPFASGSVNKIREVDVRFAAYPLLDYATFMWPIHSERFSLSDRDEHLILGFFETKKLDHGGPFEAWVQSLLHSADIDVIRETEPVYYAASFNMTSVLQLILRPEYEVDVNKRGGRYSSPPLFVAIWRGNVEAAKLLLEAGANADMWDTSGQTSRHLAIRRKMKDVVNLMEEIDLRASAKAAGEEPTSSKELVEDYSEAMATVRKLNYQVP
ncbi:vegetative incompatibility protein HET-E-1 [Colletotrichum spaethianum]|uniref:Vegetative incompatibility protein HET-E-1 n=1 Tax=Colletotrichum spaethianum TaxID=700344 RepID=A0AA37P092_9PEZI|nr:vegetative incompatibility protein HET-E-1 [Colletotrichum spaethianum]GKT45290.1 vegetative incompatibility protein HET-E-1 [Colletotrichum spaethianum]